MVVVMVMVVVVVPAADRVWWEHDSAFTRPLSCISLRTHRPRSFCGDSCQRVVQAPAAIQTPRRLVEW